MEAAVAATSSLLLVSGGARRSSPTTLPSPSLPIRSPCKSCCSFTTSTARQQQQQLACGVAAPRLGSKGSRSSRSRTGWRCSSSATGGSSTTVERWILDPAGDGDWRHIGYKVARPGAIEIVSDALTVGRVADKADIVLPIATVSGTHARLEQKGGSLLVTDLGSTNGTYINERRLNPGFPISIEPGSFLIFGDIHLAMFRVRKVRVEVPSTEPEEVEPETKKEEVVSAAAVEDAGFI